MMSRLFEPQLGGGDRLQTLYAGTTTGYTTTCLHLNQIDQNHIKLPAPQLRPTII